eukprot:TRINITY_DN8421_c0_g2_i1.p1 TRINITY_DN8421_c0_g2~~TRINITY_DN8421_c0_g2_i1.p1  ORF type:complete len:380 (+),score=59.03 TRINITY_DN8421_c0_g2_i1:492-1631(+)
MGGDQEDLPSRSSVGMGGAVQKVSHSARQVRPAHAPPHPTETPAPSSRLERLLASPSYAHHARGFHRRVPSVHRACGPEVLHTVPQDHVDELVQCLLPLHWVEAAVRPLPHQLSHASRHVDSEYHRLLLLQRDVLERGTRSRCLPTQALVPRCCVHGRVRRCHREEEEEEGGRGEGEGRRRRSSSKDNERTGAGEGEAGEGEAGGGKEAAFNNEGSDEETETIQCCQEVPDEEEEEEDADIASETFLQEGAKFYEENGVYRDYPYEVGLDAASSETQPNMHRSDAGNPLTSEGSPVVDKWRVLNDINHNAWTMKSKMLDSGFTPLDVYTKLHHWGKLSPYVKADGSVKFNDDYWSSFWPYWCETFCSPEWHHSTVGRLD